MKFIAWKDCLKLCQVGYLLAYVSICKKWIIFVMQEFVMLMSDGWLFLLLSQSDAYYTWLNMSLLLLLCYILVDRIIIIIDNAHIVCRVDVWNGRASVCPSVPLIGMRSGMWRVCCWVPHKQEMSIHSRWWHSTANADSVVLTVEGQCWRLVSLPGC